MHFQLSFRCTQADPWTGKHGAGSSIDPFWGMYRQHQTKDVRNILETYRIGSLVRYDALQHHLCIG